jgi:iron-sulfur cluster repair protein YtfE (RIC family)
VRRARSLRRSSIAGTGGGHRNTGRGGPAGEARPSPGTSPPGTPDLRNGAEATVTTGPVSDAIDRLQAEHRELAALLERGPRTVARLAAVMARHGAQEEEIFYPALRGAAGRAFAPVLAHTIRQHRTIDRLLRDLPRPTAGAKVRQRFDELRARIEEHVREVETTVFPEALRRLSRPERVSLGERMDLLAQERGDS